MKQAKQHKGVTCIYRVTSPTGKIYIGQTWDLGHRYKSGVSKRQVLLFRSYEKYGEDTHTLEILKCFDATTVNQEELDEWEIYYIKDAQINGKELLNIRSGGSRGKPSPESIRKTAEGSSKWHKANPDKVAIAREKAAQKNRGQKRTDETRSRMSEALKSYTRTPEHNANMSLAKTGQPSFMKGKKFSEQAAQNIREGIKNNRVMTTLTPVKQFDTNGVFIKEWPSIASAATELGISKTNITACSNGRKHALTAGGFIWKKSNDSTPINPDDYKQEFKPKQTKVAQMLGGVIIKTFDSVKEAALATRTDRPGIFSCLSGKQVKAGGFNWKKID